MNLNHFRGLLQVRFEINLFEYFLNFLNRSLRTLEMGLEF